jgi:hypothetical protein
MTVEIHFLRVKWSIVKFMRNASKNSICRTYESEVMNSDFTSPPEEHMDW